MLLALVALGFLVTGLRLVIVRRKRYRRTITSLIVIVIGLLPAAFSMLGFVATRKLPSAADAPQVGQKVPDFTLPNALGKPVSLDDLLAAGSEAKTPKAVLLIFYRGYW